MSADWPIRCLNEFISIKHGFAFKGEYFSDEPTNDVLVTPGNFAVGGGFKSDKLKYYNGPIPEEYILKPDDLIVTMTDLSKQADTLGFSALVPVHPLGCYLHNQRIGLVEFKETELDKLFLYYLLRSREYRHHVVSSATGSTVKHTSPSRIVSYEFQVPPLEVQRSIGSNLKTFEDKIELNQQTNQTLEQIAQAIFKSWFVDFEPTRAKIIAKEQGADLATQELAAQAILCGAITLEQLAELEQNLATTLQQAIDEKLSQDTQTPNNAEQLKATAALFPNALVESELGEIPEGWKVMSFADWVKVTKGKSITRKKAVPGNVPVVAGGLLPAYWHNVHNVEGPAITISASGANAGYVNLYHQNIWSSDSSYIDKDSTKYFYVAYTCLKFYQKTIFDMQTGAAQPHIYPKDFERLKHVLPCEGVLSLLESILIKNFKYGYNLDKESECLSGLRDTLLPKLLSGELDVSALADNSEANA